MSNEINSEYKDTKVAMAYLKRYNSYVIMKSLGVFILIVSLIPYLLIDSEAIENRIIPALITAIVGLIMIFLASFLINKLKEKSMQKYTIRAHEYISDNHKVQKQIFNRDLIIAVLMIFLVPVIYYLIVYKASFIPIKTHKYVNSVLIVVLAIALFLIFHSKGKKDAYKIFEEISIY